MKKFYFVKSLMAIMIWTGTTTSHAQIIPGGTPAKFGIDADVRANTHSFGTSMPAPAGSDDWFVNAGGTGIGVIDTTGGAYIKTLLQAGSNFEFSMPMAFPRFAVQNGNMMLDARFAHDNVGSDSTTFSGGKNGQNPLTSWSTNPGPSSILDKCDIVDTYIHLRRNGSVITGPNPSPLILIMGGSVYSSTGTHYMDFELYKQKMEYNKTTGKFTNTGPAFSGGHTRWEFNADKSVYEIGDMQVSFSFSGASVDALNIYIWVSLTDYNTINPLKFDFVPNSFYPSDTHPGYGYAEITANQPGDPLPVWGVVNTGATSTAPFWGTFIKGGAGPNGYSAHYGNGEFAEVAIDLTALGTDPAFNPYNNPCNPPFSRMIAKTRSSSSFSAALKDFTGPYAFVADPMVPPDLNPPAWLACNVSTVDINPISVFPSPAIYEWSTLTGNIMTRVDSTGIKVNQPGTYVLKTRSFLGCSSLSDSVTITKDDNKPIAKGNGPYYVTTIDPIAQLKGGDPVASNYSTPFGNSQGLLWNWTGPAGFTANTRFADTDNTGTYTLTVTELRNGCTATATADVIFLNTLPIKLINFAAAAVNKNTIDVKWSTATEDGNEKYILERSTNGINFSPVYNVTVSRASAQSNYGYRDDITGITSNTIYYRVKIYSHSALYSMSKIVKINSKPDQTHNHIVSVIQNAAKTNPVVNFYSAVNGAVSLNVVDADGKVVYKTLVQAVTGLNTIELPANRLNTFGIKFIQLAIQQDKLNYKFLFK